ncbi:YibE/F family protein [Lachnospiraceae bacterium 54-53]
MEQKPPFVIFRSGHGRKHIQWVLFAVLMAAFALFLIQFNQVDIASLVSTEGRTFERAKVIEILKDNVQEDGNRVGQQNVLIEIQSGPRKGQTAEATSNNGFLFGAACQPGMRVVVIQSLAGDISIHTVYSVDREWAVLGFVLIFLAVVCVIGGKKGVLTCVGLVFTFICIIWLYIPMIYKGYSPFLAAVLVAAVTTFVIMYLLGGWSGKTACAVIGTVGGVVIAGISAFLFGKATMINTLILAFVGSAASTLLLNYAYELPYLQIINSNNMVIEVMQGISGSLGVVMTVPIVSLIASFAAAGRKQGISGTSPD